MNGNKCCPQLTLGQNSPKPPPMKIPPAYHLIVAPTQNNVTVRPMPTITIKTNIHVAKKIQCH